MVLKPTFLMIYPFKALCKIEDQYLKIKEIEKTKDYSAIIINKPIALNVTLVFNHYVIKVTNLFNVMVWFNISLQKSFGVLP